MQVAKLADMSILAFTRREHENGHASVSLPSLDVLGVKDLVLYRR